MLTAENWPIAAAMLPMGDAQPAGPDAPPPVERWSDDLREVSDAGFSHVDLTDSWVRYGELSAPQIAKEARAASSSRNLRVRLAVFMAKDNSR